MVLVEDNILVIDEVWYINFVVHKCFLRKKSIVCVLHKRNQVWRLPNYLGFVNCIVLGKYLVLFNLYFVIILAYLWKIWSLLGLSWFLFISFKHLNYEYINEEKNILKYDTN